MGTPIANVALTDTFDQWRTQLNQVINAYNSENVVYFTSNSASLTITPLVTRGDTVYLSVSLSTDPIADTSNSAISSANAVNKVYRFSGNVYSFTNSVYNVVNSALSSLNVVYSSANAAYNISNSILSLVNSAYSAANGAYATVNTFVTVNNVSFTQANVAFARANTSYNVGNFAFAQANASVALANGAYIAANLAILQANASYAAGNVHHTLTNTAFGRTNSVYAVANTIYNQDNIVFGVANAGYSSGNANFAVTNSAFATANAGYTSGNSNFAVTNAAFNFANSTYEFANAAYAVANAANATAQNVAPQITPSYNTANLAYTKANDAYSLAQTLGGNTANILSNQDISFKTANLAFDLANSVTINATAAFAVANLAYGIAITSNGWSNTINAAIQTQFPAVNNYTISVGAAINSVITTTNTNIQTQISNLGTSVNNYTTSVGTAANNYMLSVAAAGNSWANQVNSYIQTMSVTQNGVSTTLVTAANNWANTKVASVTSNSSGRLFANTTTDVNNLVRVDIDLARTNVVAATYGSASQIPIIQVDAYGRINTAANVAVQGMDYAYVNASMGSANNWANTKLANVAGSDRITMQYSSVGGITTGYVDLALTSVTFGSYASNTTVGTFSVDPYGRLYQASNVAIDFRSANNWANAINTAIQTQFPAVNNYVTNTFYPKTGGTIGGDVVVTGNLTISGLTTYANTQTLLIGDNIFVLNADLPAASLPSENAGLDVNRGSSANASLIWNEVTDKWTFSNGGIFADLASNTDILSANAWANTKVSSVAGTLGRITSSGGTTPTIDLSTAGAGASNYSGGVSDISVDAYGRVTSVTASAGYVTSSGVTSITAGTGLSGGTISTSGTISLATSGVLSSTYGGATTTARFAVDSYGRITSAANAGTTGVATLGYNSPLTNSGTATDPVISLTTSGVTAAAYSSGISAITVDTYGRITAITGSAGYVTSSGITSINLGAGINGYGGSITTTGTIALSTTGVTAGTYSSGISAITVDAYGRVSSVTGSAGYVTSSGSVNYATSAGSISGVTGTIITSSNYTSYITSVSSATSATTATTATSASYTTGGSTGSSYNVYCNNLYASSDVYASYSSDRSLKKNIKNISNALEKLSKINGVEFDWTDEYLNSQDEEMRDNIPNHTVGVIAQEVEQVLPEVVTTRDNGNKAVKYDLLTSLLIEAVKELSGKVDTLQNEINILRGN